MKPKYLFTALLAMTLIGCGKQPGRSVEWYDQHPQERSADLAACQSAKQTDDTGRQNCKNSEVSDLHSLTGAGTARIK